MRSVNIAELKENEPYSDEEFQDGMKRFLESAVLPLLVSSYLPGVSIEEFKRTASEIKNVEAFHKKVISKVMNSVIHQSSSGFSVSGWENQVRDRKYLYLSNHRDIVCDPALFIYSIYLNGFSSPKICLGDNLLTHPLIIDLVKMNKGITVKRHLRPRELLKWSTALSAYIARQIGESIDSIWIAQREGRAKDGNDRTQPGLIKMVTLAGEGTFLDRVRNLHIVPIAVSYEYDPCDILKARELYLTSKNGNYSKAPDEDLTSMITGIRGFKGKIHVHIGKEISKAVEQAEAYPSKRDQVRVISAAIDEQIHLNYKNWPSNYLAHDLLEGTDEMKEHYSPEEKVEFIERMEKNLATLKTNPSDEEGIRRFLLASYANPVRNAIKAEKKPIA